MLKNKFKIIIIGVATFVLLMAFLFLSFYRTQQAPPQPKPTPTSVVPIITSTNVIPTQVQKQEQADINFSKYMGKSRAPYPWYNSLPLQTPTYFVYFDIPQNHFVGKIYSSSNNLSASQVNDIKQEAEQKLKNLEVNLQQYPIVWQTGL